MLDADGRIDRDFALFFDRLTAGAAIVIDDVEDKVRIKKQRGPNGAPKLRIDQKHRISHLLVGHFTERGLITGSIVKNTWIGRKVAERLPDDFWPEVVAQYRHLVFADAEPSRSREALVALKVFLTKVLPAPALRVAKRVARGVGAAG
jgi:hypothetical protein